MLRTTLLFGLLTLASTGCGARLEVLLEPEGGIAANDASSASQWPGAPDGATKDDGGVSGGSVLCSAAQVPCLYDTYCNDEYCGEVEGHGQKLLSACVQRPFECPSVPWDGFGVCGCDGRIYTSVCDARRLGVSAKFIDNACRPKACATNVDCASDEYCDFPDGQCGRSNAGGACTRRPTSDECPRTDDCPSFLACNGKYYCHACEAAVQGFALPRKPACTFGSDQTCNDNATISSLRGRCDSKGQCQCDAGSSLNFDTGRCR